jgi:hypothetical protein
MKTYRLYHRVLKQFREITAMSAQEACQRFGWLIVDVWIRIKTQGKYAHGWANITPRLKP